MDKKPFYKSKRFWILLKILLVGATSVASFLPEKTKDILMKLILLFILLLIGSCVTQQKLDPMVYYKKDLMIEYDGEDYYGVAVLPYKDEYKIRIKAHGEMNTFSVVNCHMEKDTANPDGKYFLKGRTTIRHKPSPIEKEGDCPLHIAVFNEKKKHGWGFIAFEHPSYTLPAVVHCNGEVEKYNGVSVCSTRQGLKQRIIFSEEVLVGHGVSGPSQRSEPCPPILSYGSRRGKTFDYKLPSRECSYIFTSIATGAEHILHNIGHEDSIVRD
jgi:hypothetical protein